MKQVIVLRKDLNMRKGKMVAQGCHAARGAEAKADGDDVEEWEESGQTKVCVGVNSEAELLAVYQKALDSYLPACLIRDAGRTEFNGVPTLTAVGIGPARTEEVDKVTGELSLL